MSAASSEPTQQQGLSLHRPDFEAIFDAVPGLYLVLQANDPTYTIVAVNGAYAKAMRNDRQSLVGRNFFEVFPANQAALLASFRRVMATRTALQERDPGATVSPMLGQNGEIEFLIHSIEDVVIRERQEVDEKLRVSEARFSLAFEQAPIGMVLLTPHGQLLEVNQAYLDMLGYSVEELSARDSASYTHPDDVALTRDFFNRLRSGPVNTGSIEKRYFRKDGELLWARASATLRRDEAGQPAQVIAIVENITARKRAEARYRFLAESIPQMVWTATPGGFLDYVNGQGSTYFGVSGDALLGTGWLQWIHPEDQEHAIAAWTKSLQSGIPYETAFRLKRSSDKSWRRHLVRALPLTGDVGTIVQWFGTCTDIEGETQADANLQQQWHTFDTALSNTLDFTYIFDLDGRFTYVNRALLALWEKPLEEAIGKNFFDLGYPPELAEQLQNQIQHVISTLQPLRDQTPYTAPSGLPGYYDYIFVPVMDAKGNVRAVAGSTRDITEQTRVSQQIEEDRRRWRELLFQTPAAIAVLRGSEHRFEWANPDYARLVGRPAESLIGKTVVEALPEVGDQIYVNLLNGVYQTGEPFVGHESCVRLQTNDGVLQDFYVNFVYLPTRNVDGVIDGIFVHVTDVTDMVVARKHIEESERQFRTLAETIPHLAWMADETGHIFWYNRRWYDYTGTTLAEMQGWGWDKVHDPQVLPEVLSGWRRSLSTGEPFETVFPLRRADGEFRPFLTRVEPVRDSAGRIVRWFGTNTDITEQRRTEEQLRRMNRELEEFAYVASHDLQEPLRMVNIYTELILKNYATDKETLDQYSGFVQKGVLRMEALIHDLLTFSRSVHTEELQIGKADLSAALTEALAVLKPRVEEVGARIHAPPLPAVRGDTEQLAHVFQNILSNALKYRKSDVPPEIQIRAVRQQNMWTISVQDNGIGFDAQYAERIFGLFKRLHKDEYPGTGLGLAICKRIVERYGGQIWAEGKLGEGATFFFTLPHVEGLQS